MSRIKMLLALGFAMISFAGAQQASAQTVCSNQAFQGLYGFSATGWSVTTAGTFPTAAAGNFLFDGQGGITTTLTLSANGQVLPSVVSSGTYTLNSDCTGTITFSVAVGDQSIPFTLNLFVDDNNKEFRAISTTQGTVLTLEGRKQFTTTP